MTKIQMFFRFELNSFLDELISIIENIRDFNNVKSDLMGGSYESFIWWSFYNIIAFIQIILIFYLLWLIIKRQIFDPDFSDKKNLRKTIIGIIIISGIQLLSKKALLYPLLEIQLPF
ncbi:MAG: hypothetical protein ACW981_02320 [Candidatus Hodarchaeales archaeon]